MGFIKQVSFVLRPKVLDIIWKVIPSSLYLVLTPFVPKVLQITSSTTKLYFVESSVRDMVEVHTFLPGAYTDSYVQPRT